MRSVSHSPQPVTLRSNSPRPQLTGPTQSPRNAQTYSSSSIPRPVQTYSQVPRSYVNQVPSSSTVTQTVHPVQRTSHQYSHKPSVTNVTPPPAVRTSARSYRPSAASHRVSATAQSNSTSTFGKPLPTSEVLPRQPAVHHLTSEVSGSRFSAPRDRVVNGQAVYSRPSALYGGREYRHRISQVGEPLVYYEESDRPPRVISEREYTGNVYEGQTYHNTFRGEPRVTQSKESLTPLPPRIEKRPIEHVTASVVQDGLPDSSRLEYVTESIPERISPVQHVTFQEPVARTARTPRLSAPHLQDSKRVKLRNKSAPRRSHGGFRSTYEPYEGDRIKLRAGGKSNRIRSSSFDDGYASGLPGSRFVSNRFNEYTTTGGYRNFHEKEGCNGVRAYHYPVVLNEPVLPMSGPSRPPITVTADPFYLKYRTSYPYNDLYYGIGSSTINNYDAYLKGRASSPYISRPGNYFVPSQSDVDHTVDNIMNQLGDCMTSSRTQLKKAYTVYDDPWAPTIRYGDYYSPRYAHYPTSYNYFPGPYSTDYLHRYRKY